MFNYFAGNKESILTIESYYYHSLVIEETLNFYINKLMEKNLNIIIYSLNDSMYKLCLIVF